MYIDTRYNTIVNRTVPKELQRQVLDTPDSFEYTVAEAIERVLP